MRTRKASIEKELAEIEAKARSLMEKGEESDGSGVDSFVRERLEDLGERRHGLEITFADVTRAIGEIQHEAVDEAAVRKALESFGGAFEELSPDQQKRMVRLVLAKAELGPKTLMLNFYGRPGEVATKKISGHDASRPETGDWLPGSDSN